MVRGHEQIRKERGLNERRDTETQRDTRKEERTYEMKDKKKAR